MSEAGRTPFPRAARPAGPGSESEPQALGQPAASRYNLRSGRNIVPREGVAGNAFSIVIGIMAFLACLTLGAVASIGDTAGKWQNQISTEATVQIKPLEKERMEEALKLARQIVLEFDGISDARIIDLEDTAHLLEPWLGSGFDINELPVPRIMTIEIESGARPDFDAIRLALAEKIPEATLDDHRAWVDRLVSMAWTMIAMGVFVLLLVLSATVLTVVFATRGAMAGNREIVEVLHFVGADSKFIAGEFQRHFLTLALRGALSGGAAAAAVFIGLLLWARMSRATPQGDQVAALFGGFSIGWTGYGGIALLVGSIALLAAITSRFTVLSHVGKLENQARIRQAWS
jgi:cell division transport system permease protein